jgi:hypothetical protein
VQFERTRKGVGWERFSSGSLVKAISHSETELLLEEL